MKISVTQGEKVIIKFQGKINMSQEIAISQKDASQLGKILTDAETTSFETE